MKRLVLIRESSQGEGILSIVAAHLSMDPNGYKSRGVMASFSNPMFTLGLWYDLEIYLVLEREVLGISLVEVVWILHLFSSSPSLSFSSFLLLSSQERGRGTYY